MVSVFDVCKSIGAIDRYPSPSIIKIILNLKGIKKYVLYL